METTNKILILAFICWIFKTLEKSGFLSKTSRDLRKIALPTSHGADSNCVLAIVSVAATRIKLIPAIPIWQFMAVKAKNKRL